MTANKIVFIKRINWLRLLKRHAWVIVIFLFMSFLFMGKSLTNCQNTVIGDSGGGDHLSGIIWLFTFTNAPYGGTSLVTNFPFGESVSQPQLITSAVYLVPTWIISKAIGAVCAWNLMVLFGYMSSALVMYAFIYWLLRRRGIALFGGLAVGFTPYHYFESMGHLSYIQSALFVALLWAFLAFWKESNGRKALLLGVLTALLFYSDGYFPFIGGVMLAALFSYGLTRDLIDYRRKKDRMLVRRIKFLFLSLLAALVLLLPIAYVKVIYGDRIDKSLQGSRSNVMEELQRYGAKPADYILPSTESPVAPLRETAQNYRADHPHSEKGEYSLYLGFTVIALAAYATYMIIGRRNRLLASDSSWLKWVGGAGISIVFAAGLLSLVPHLKIGNLTVTMPSELLGQLTSYWRVPARLYLAVNVAVATLASIGLWVIVKGRRNNARRLLVISAVIILLIIELMPVNPLSRSDQWSFRNAYHTFQWLRDQHDIKAIAAYPMRPHPFSTSYFGDQVTHKKSMLNSFSSSDKELYLHRALAGLGDGQTLGVLKTMGINDVLLYRIPPGSQPAGLIHRYGDYGASVSSIDPSVKALDHALIPLDGFNPPGVDPKTQVGCHKALDLTANLTLRHLVKGPRNNNVQVGFTLKGQPGQSVILYSKGQLLGHESFDSRNELKRVSLTLDDDQLLSIYHISERSKDYVAVCDLTASN